MIYSINEGQQAEEYKARKKTERIESHKKDVEDDKKYNKRSGSRYITGGKIERDSKGKLHMDHTAADRYGKSYEIVEDELNKRCNRSDNDPESEIHNRNYENLFYATG